MYYLVYLAMGSTTTELIAYKGLSKVTGIQGISLTLFHGSEFK